MLKRADIVKVNLCGYVGGGYKHINPKSETSDSA